MKKLERLAVLFVTCLLAAGLTDLFAGDPQQQTPSQPQSASAQQSPAARLGMFPYPKNNQSAAQQQKDEGECYDWAKQQTGIDPAAPATPPKQEAKKPKGGGVKGAAGGAAAGATVGAITGDAGEGAAAGAAVGAMRGRRQQKKAGKQAEKQAQAAAGQQKQQTLEVFKKAFAGCMDGRGYSVK